MAEAFGVVAGGLGVASLAIQIVENLNKVIKFCESIKEAPTDIHRILLELQLLSKTVSAIQLAYEIHALPETSVDMTRKCLSLVRDDIRKLSSLSLELERKLNSGKRITRTWARVQTVLSESKIAALRGHLEQAKAGLQLLQSHHIFEDIQVLKAMFSQTPKSLGHFWETGELEDHVKVDDGLEKPFYLPLDLCSTPEIFISILSQKFKSKKLAGLKQIELGHFRAFDWGEKQQISRDSWDSVIKEGRGIKLAFIMTHWHSLPQNKCMRCFKPRDRGPYGRRYNKCSSCGLELRRVEPDAISFETDDITVGLSADQYRDYRLASLQKPSPSSSTTPKTPNNVSPSNQSPRAMEFPSRYANPPIDAVCKRLIVKWEPVFNSVHRYLHCRCVIRLSTPSHIEEEQTILIFAPCPRHNTSNISHLDYGDIDYREDQYFARFGGYRSFQALIFYFFTENIYKILGGERFLAPEDKEESLQAFDAFWKQNKEGLEKVLSEYEFDVNDELERNGFKLREEDVQGLKEGRKKRWNELAANLQKLGIPEPESEVLRGEQRLDVRDTPMMLELNEILNGKWDGQPHWALDD